jgi:H+/Cl- antiporter ClcA
LLLWPQKRGDFALWRWRDAHPVLFAGTCGAVIAIMGWASGGMSYGSGYAITSEVVAGGRDLPWYAVAVRFLATVLSYYSGIPGGIFAPALAVGAALGFDLAHLAGLDSNVILMVALCMTGFLAAVTQSPITSAIIVMEMIDGHAMVIGLMAVAFISNAVSSRMGPELYQQLAQSFGTGVRPPPS